MLSLLTMVSRVLGLLREMTKAALLGTSALGDAFSVAFMIPNLFRRLFAEGSISAAFIPTYKEYLLAGDGEKTGEFLSSSLTILTVLVSAAVGLGMLLCPLFIPIFGQEALDETLLLTRIMFPFLGFISLAALFQGILNTLGVFAPSGLGPILLNITVIGCSYGLGRLTANPARSMAVGVLIGGFLEWAVQVPFTSRRGIRLGFTGLGRALRNSGTRQVLRLIAPTIVGMAAYQLNDLVSTVLARRAGEGILSSLQYSLRLQELILGVFAVSIGTVLLPDITEAAKTGDWDRYNRRLIGAMDIIALITIPLTFFALSQGESLIRLLFQSRRFDDESVRLTLSAFRYHMPGLFFIALNRILAPAFYAQSDSRSPTLAGILGFGVNMVLAAILTGLMRGAGIALALSAASAANTALLLLFLRRNPHIAVGQALLSALGYTAKLAFFSVAAVLPLLYLNPRLAAAFAGRGRLISYGLPLLISLAVFCSIGIALLLISRDKQVRAVLGILRHRPFDRLRDQ
jgi:putative peptidoglycan lipid II flippase